MATSIILVGRCPVFFFSSRRRHTRCLSDWSSDVCSSDLHVGHQWDHDLRFNYDAFTFDLDGGLEDHARLHLGDLGINDAQAAAAMTKHRVELDRKSVV